LSLVTSVAAKFRPPATLGQSWEFLWLAEISNGIETPWENAGKLKGRQ